MQTTVLYCSDPLNGRRPDAHFAEEARAVRAAGGGVALIDHDALLAGDAGRAVAGVPAGAGALWYRGWMIPAARYAALDAALRERGGGLRVTPDAYRRAHELPGWYEAFAGLTPPSRWLATPPGKTPEPARLADAAAALPSRAGIVKDYVKSRKHEWAEACHLPDLADRTAVHRVVNRFVELQGEDLAGGVVLRAFEAFTATEGVATEVRVWWRDGEPRLVTAHPDSPYAEAAAPDLGPVRAAVAELGCAFVTTDLALRADGVWRVVEVGDGQVSDLHREADRAAFVGLLTGG
ncbi:ATP-grasp domain-containing protein [Streptomyces sp. NBC_00193]|uniref:ATP-grasp domain-containing protein n=1 Tax=unclassified Streptomyces TaxID=2593676 RepID=UPI00224FCAE7|nr:MULTISPECIES: ATP-grasp domain-containing protein [unclassified Streptomyces]MCX5126616.1 ATP-grasp domain-containing protein [Streptomyces sp. NBC_00347]MCX5300250.1 ATP-grasp domain-containing protein [Streptomyces sp. NBC_00193]